MGVKMISKETQPDGTEVLDAKWQSLTEFAAAAAGHPLNGWAARVALQHLHTAHARTDHAERKMLSPLIEAREIAHFADAGRRLRLYAAGQVAR